MPKKSIALAAVLLVATIFTMVLKRDDGRAPAPRQLSGSELVLREGRLHEKASGEVFNGILAEDFAPQKPKLRIDIRDGRSHGISRRFYENGRPEVEQEFVAGVAYGKRTHWYANGKKKSEGSIVDGKMEGAFISWYENGQKAAEAQMANGQPHGLSLAWYASGLPKERIERERGQVVTRFFWEDADA